MSEWGKFKKQDWSGYVASRPPEENRINASIRALSDRLIRAKSYTKRDKIIRRINQKKAQLLAIKLAEY